MNLIADILKDFKRRIAEKPPSPFLIDEAKNLLDNFPRDMLPDWVEIISEGNPGRLESVIEVALADMKAEEVGNGKV